MTLNYAIHHLHNLLVFFSYCSYASVSKSVNQLSESFVKRQIFTIKLYLFLSFLNIFKPHCVTQVQKFVSTKTAQMIINTTRI